MSPDAPGNGSAAVPPPADSWVEVYRGPRRRAQVIIRVLTDASLPSRDARRAGADSASAREGVVQVPASNAEQAKLLVEMLKKNFPQLFAAGPARGE